MIFKIFNNLLFLMLSGSLLYAQPETSEIAQIKVFQLEPGSRDAFHQIITRQAIPLHNEWNITVSEYGPSMNDDNGYYVVRTFRSLAELEDKEEALYSSRDWRDGPREGILSSIKDYSTLVIPKDSLADYTAQSLTVSGMDKIILSKLNNQFIENFIKEDVEAHEEIIHSDFVCINGDGTISNREEYLEGWASAYTHSGYTSFHITDEDIRIFGDMALVRSKTVYTKKVDGKRIAGNSLYTDTYIKENGKWLCVQAHITPVTN